MASILRPDRLGSILLCLGPLSGECASPPPCAATLDDLRVLMADRSFPLRWHETTMSDRKPLLFSILERDGGIFLEFVKTGDGLLAEGAGIVCRKGVDLEARFLAGRFRLGPAASWTMRLALAGGRRITLSRIGSEQLRLETSAWSGTFSSHEGSSHEGTPAR